MNNEYENINYEKIKKAFDNSIKLHLNLANNSWRNGFVKELKEDFFLFTDDVNNTEPIFFIEIKSVKPFMQDEKDNN